MSAEANQEKHGGSWRTGDTISDRYQLMELIGEGGMGSVFKATDLKLNKVVAVKTLSGKELNDEDFVRFHREAKVASTIWHKNVVETYDFGVTGDGYPFLVMQLIHGVTLKKFLSGKRGLDVQTGLRVLTQLAEGMRAVHSAGIVHRDLKTSNIIVNIDDQNLTLKLLDFGVARAYGQQSDTLTKSGDIIGTPRYISPEQVVGAPIDERSDIYSLGCIAFEMFSGRPAFLGDTALETIQMHLADERPELSQEVHIPDQLRRLIATMIARQPEDRIQSMVELQNEIKRIAQANDSKDSSDCEAAERIAPAKRDSMSVSAVIIATVVVSVPALAALWVFLPTIQQQADKGKNSLENKLPKEAPPEKTDDKPGLQDHLAGPTKSFMFIDSAGSRLLAGAVAHKKQIPVILIDSKVTDEDIVNIAKLKPEWILLSRSGVNDKHLQVLSQCKSIEELRLFRDDGITFRGISYLRQLPKLVYLSVRDCGLDNRFLKEAAGIKTMEVLDMEGNKKVTLEGLSVLSKCPNLKVITLRRTGVVLKPGDEERLKRELHLIRVWTGKTFDSDSALETVELFQGADDQSPIGSGEVPADLRNIYGEYGRRKRKGTSAPTFFFAE